MPLTGKIEGTGIGLRTPHMQELLTKEFDIPWLEVLADNHLAEGGFDRSVVFALREKYPMTLHGVSASIGSTDPLDKNYLSLIKTLMYDLEISWFSDHLCFTHIEGVYSHDLLPLPYTEEAVKHCASKIAEIQDFLGQQILIENVSSYISLHCSQLSEAEFVRAVAEEANCLLLLDLNNIYVNQFNHGDDARKYIDTMPIERVREVHLAGFENKQNYLLDAHNNPVSDEVWELYRHLLKRNSGLPTLIEWDNDIPSLHRLLQEKSAADSLRNKYLSAA